MTDETIYLAGGCFWCTEAVFARVRGVRSVQSGYANGHQAQRPTYEEVCRGHSGYAEVVRVQFDPQVIGLRDVLTVFFATHDPTTPNRQGHDVGTQYRSGIYTSHAGQEALARAVIAELEQAGTWGARVVTEVLALRNYWPAEDYHQDYFAKNPQQGFCTVVIAPKVHKLRQAFAQWLKP